MNSSKVLWAQIKVNTAAGKLQEKISLSNTTLLDWQKWKYHLANYPSWLLAELFKYCTMAELS